jgi:hypothetical protein
MNSGQIIQGVQMKTRVVVVFGLLLICSAVCFSVTPLMAQTRCVVMADASRLPTTGPENQYIIAWLTYDSSNQTYQVQVSFRGDFGPGYVCERKLSMATPTQNRAIDIKTQLIEANNSCRVFFIFLFYPDGKVYKTEWVYCFGDPCPTPPAFGLFADGGFTCENPIGVKGTNWGNVKSTYGR